MDWDINESVTQPTVVSMTTTTASLVGSQSMTLSSDSMGAGNDGSGGGATAMVATSNASSLMDTFDQSLMNQFNCLSTNDHEDLVNQLRQLFSDRISERAASFYLEMNNWNLQAAVCSYLDSESNESEAGETAMTKMTSVSSNDASVPSPTLSMSFFKLYDDHYTDLVRPLTKFQRAVQLLNNGSEVWPEGCSLRHISGPSVIYNVCVPVACTYPGAICTLNIDCISPNIIGTFRTVLRLQTSTNACFGDEIVITFTVVAATNTVNSSSDDTNATQVASTSGTNHSIRPMSSSFERIQLCDSNETETAASLAPMMSDDSDRMMS